MSVNANINFSSSNGLVPVAVEQYMYRNFLPRLINNRIYGKDFQMRTLPPHNGATVQFNKMNPFPADVVPLREGVTPDGQSITTSKLTATVKPYGAYVAMTDETDWMLIDETKRETSVRLGDQAADVLDAIDRAAMMSGTNVQYAGGKTSRAGITAADILTYDDIKKAARTLSKNKIKPFADGFYHAIIGPETEFDLMSDPMWVDIAKYQNRDNLEKGEIGKMYNVKFFRTTNPQIYESESYLYNKVASLAIKGYDSASKMLSVAAATISTHSNTEEIAYAIRCLNGKMVNIYDASETANILAVIDRAVLVGQDVNIYLRWIGDDFTYASGDLIKPMGSVSNIVHATVVYGQDMAGGVELGGGGKNVEMIIKPAGSSGTDDPLNQRSTVGWKVKGYCATILQDAAIVRIEHGVTA